MEGKEINNEDENKKSGSSKSEQEESDDFGLPEASYDSDTDEGEVNDDADDSLGSSEDQDEEPEYESASGKEEKRSQYSYTADEDSKKGSAGLIVFLSIVGVLVIAFAVYWFVIRTPKKETKPVVQKPVQEQVVDTARVEPVVEAPAVDESVKVEQATTSGTFETITEKSGRYYIVLNSFFDEDLANDYAKGLAENGTSTFILSPLDRKGFRRVVLKEEFGNWREAEARLGDLKMTYGEAIWVLKF